MCKGMSTNVGRVQTPGLALRVSRAIWPLQWHHSLSTSPVAQQRRFLRLKGLWYPALDAPGHLLKLRQRQYRALSMLASSLAVLTLIAFSVCVPLFIYQLWILLLVLIVAWCFIAGTVTGLLVREIRVVLVYKKMLRMRHMQAAMRLYRPFHTTRGMLETPMPLLSTSRVRIMNTIDLSSSGVRHFLHEEQRRQTDDVPRTQFSYEEEGVRDGSTLPYSTRHSWKLPRE